MSLDRVTYDVALSFAGEDRAIARKLATKLKSAGYLVFFDEFQEAELWGEDLSVKLKQVYKEQARFCVMFISEHYARKPWTNHERQAALSRAFNERKAYILPLRIDDTELPGFSDVVGYVDLRNVSISKVYTLLSQKLGTPHNIDKTESDKKSRQISVDRVREVLAACYRRAVFARMHAQISVKAMFDSLADCRVTLQKLIIFVEPQELQQLVASLIGELDFLETLKHKTDLSQMATEVNASKLRIIAALLQLSKDAGVSFTLPASVTEEAFFTKEEAEMPPSG